MEKFIVDIKNQKDEDLFYFLIKNAKVCVVDFYAEWCSPCKKLGIDLEKNMINYEKIYKNLLMPNSINSDVNLIDKEIVQNKIVFLKINVDVLNNLSDIYKISSIPHVIFYKKGVLQHQILRSCDQIFDFSNKLLD